MLNDVHILFSVFIFGKITTKRVEQSTVENLCLHVNLGVKWSGKTKLKSSDEKRVREKVLRKRESRSEVILLRNLK